MKKREKLFFAVILIGFLAISFVSAEMTFQSVLDSWARSGVFDLLLPFLLVFALVFGILTKVEILGENKGVHAIIATALGLMVLWEGHFTEFLKIFSTNISIAITMLLGAIILIGLFFNSEDKDTKWIIYVLFGVGIIAFLVVTADTFSRSNIGYSSNLWDEYGPALITIIILGLLIWAIIAGGKSSSSSKNKNSGG